MSYKRVKVQVDGVLRRLVSHAQVLGFHEDKGEPDFKQEKYCETWDLERLNCSSWVESGLEERRRPAGPLLRDSPGETVWGPIKGRSNVNGEEPKGQMILEVGNEDEDQG